jgi:hypothetical protein
LVVGEPGVDAVEELPGFFVPPTFGLLYGPEFGERALPLGVPAPEARQGFDCELFDWELPVPLRPAGPVPELSDDWP